jgi:hypothetical protein
MKIWDIDWGEGDDGIPVDANADPGSTISTWTDSGTGCADFGYKPLPKVLQRPGGVSEQS